MAHAPARSPASADVTAVAAALADARTRTLGLVAGLDDDAVERVHSTLMSPLVWDLGHIAAFEDLWLVHRHGGEPMLRPEMGDVYDAFETPRANRGDLPFLRRDEALRYLDDVRERSLGLLEERGPGDGAMHELVIRHELQHAETMLQTIQLARFAGHEPGGRVALPRAPGGHTGLELVAVPGGHCEIGAAPTGFAYDNERPRHTVDVAGFRIGRTPVTNATWLSFSEGGGYERREWWSDEGWAWKEDEDITHPGSWTEDGREWRLGRCEDIAPDDPVIHVSWFEADAFARSVGARLPTEFEWEKAAAWDQQTLTRRPYPWGGAHAPGQHANLDQDGHGVAPAGAFPAGAAPCGALGMLGDVWEWTSSRFAGYPGFRADPYPEYSEVFFGPSFRVLRGGSWASCARVATPSFRNWDLPQRRQIFAGVRLARDGGDA